MPAGKILIIDADAVSREYVAAALRGEGYKVIQAASAKQGLVAAWGEQPDLIVADPVTPDLAGEELATRLRSDARTATVPLVALSSDNQPARQKSCIGAGFSVYLVKSPDAMSGLIEKLADLLGKATVATRDDGLLITFLSAKGGTGTSSMCVNVAANMAQARRQLEVVVADLVLPIGSVAGIVGLEGGRNVVDLAELPTSALTPEFLRSELQRITDWEIHVLAGSPDPHKANELKVDRISEIVSALQHGFDYVLIDLGRTLSRISLPLIERADLVVMVVASDISTVTLSRTIWDYLRGNGVQAPAMYLILNRSVGLEGLTKAEAERIIGLPINSTVPHHAENFSLANNQHKPYAVKFSNDTTSIVLRDSAQEIMDLARELRAD